MGVGGEGKERCENEAFVWVVGGVVVVVDPVVSTAIVLQGYVKYVQAWYCG